MSANSPFPQKDLTVITTHINADFDAVASMLAAQKLYPDALVVFPGSHEKTLRNFFVQSMVYLFNMADMRDIDFDQVRRLVLVDTSQSRRIGKFSRLLSRPDLDIHVYDHHPTLSNDIRGHYEIIEPTGAAVSILARILQERDIPLTPDEATIMCLGIYEDTGAFTFSSTTEADFLAAAYLLSKGANLDIIANLIAREMSLEQVSLLNDMLHGSRHYQIRGVDVVVTVVTTEKYIPDFAFLVHKMMKMENLTALFAVARMDGKIYVVARSRSADVDVGTIVSGLGGGGHPYAAAATVKDRTLAQTEQYLAKLLRENVRSGKQARDLMSSPAVKVAPGVSCAEAMRLLTRYNMNALLVTEKQADGREELLGYITRQVVDKALYLKLDESPVREYMSTELGFVSPDAPLAEIQEQIIENKQRILPVMQDGVVAGVITRTDIFNTLVQEQFRYRNGTPPDPFREDVHARTRNIKRFMKERIPKELLGILTDLGRVGHHLGYGVYGVGGFVRDLFLYRKNEDIDIVIEGDGIAFAREYARQTPGVRIHSHEKFRTAVLIFSSGFKIDVASARMEYYRFPADLPNVEMSSIKLDLFRRDFTVNTLAIQLNPDKFGTLIDFFSAQKDIKERMIRVLHNLSFVEDPTRAFRAIRFEQRFGFSLGKLTEGLIRNLVKTDFLRKLSGRRIFTELRLILEEENPAPAIRRLHDYQLLEVIHPALIPDKRMMAAFESVRKVIAWHDLLFLDEEYLRWAVYFMALIRKTDFEQSEAICRKMGLSSKQQALFCQERFEAERALYRLGEILPAPNSRIYRMLSGFRTEPLLFMMGVSRNEAIKKAISLYFTQLRTVKISLSGKDLKQMGLEPGPLYRQILDACLDEKLNQKVASHEDELEFARSYIRNLQSQGVS